jgi:hypothetical protein
MRDRDSGRIGIQAASAAGGTGLVSAVAMSGQPSSFRKPICPVATSPKRSAYERRYQRRVVSTLMRRAHVLGYTLVKNSDLPTASSPA